MSVLAAFRVVGWVMNGMARLTAGAGGRVRPGRRAVRVMRWGVAALMALLILWWTLSTAADVVRGEIGPGSVGLAGVYLLVPPLAVALVLAMPPRRRRLDAVIGGLVLARTKQRARLVRRWREGRIEYAAFEMPFGITVEQLQRWRPALEQGLNCGVDLWYREGLFYARAVESEVPDVVTFGEFYRAGRPAGELPFGVGAARTGPVWADLADLPHLLIGGQTGGGKSGMLRQLLTWLALTNPPERLRLGLVDLKGGMEFRLFAGLPHLIGGVVRDVEAAGVLLEELNADLDRRQAAFEAAGVVNLREWNRRYPAWELPYLVLVVDETAELTAAESPGREERARHQARLASISRLVRLGRASGIHAVLATQRPDAEAVPGAIKANLPATVALRVRGEVNSRILLGEGDTSAASLPPVPGRAIWQWDIETAVQVPWLSAEEALSLLEQRYGPAAANGGTESVTQCPQPPAVRSRVRC